MSPILIIIAVVLVVLVVSLWAYVATRPDSFRIERSATINAPPEKIYPWLIDIRQWIHWSPFEELDPALQRTYSGAPSGKGAIYEWSGNRGAGQGRMEITDAAPPNRITIKLDFLRPFEAHNTAEFILAPQGSATRVTWATFGPTTVTTKLMGLVMSMDTILGKEFEKGLAKLKALAEK